MLNQRSFLQLRFCLSCNPYCQLASLTLGSRIGPINGVQSIWNQSLWSCSRKYEKQFKQLRKGTARRGVVVSQADLSYLEDSGVQAMKMEVDSKHETKRESGSKAKVIVISGPTASGKTRLALMLAKKLGGEIISADSVQVYKGLDIGSAKTPVHERQGIHHHLLDIIEPTEEYTAGDFYVHARQATSEVLSRGGVPIVVGGTGLYLRWFLYGKPETPRATAAIAAAVEREVEVAIEGAEDPWAAALSLLSAAGDHVTVRQLARNDWYRLKRALEIIQASGRPRSEFAVPSAIALAKPISGHGGPAGGDSLSTETVSSEEGGSPQLPSDLDFDFQCYFLCPPRLDLYRRIDRRCEEMVADGILGEAAALLDQGVFPNSSPASRAIGYRQAMEYLQECWKESSALTEGPFLQFLSSFQQASRNYAKRQMVWFRSERLYHWLDASLPPEELAATVTDAYMQEGASMSGKLREESICESEAATKERSYKEGKTMRTYRTALDIFSSKERIALVLEWVGKNKCSSRPS